MTVKTVILTEVFAMHGSGIIHDESVDNEANRNLDRNQMLPYSECTYIRKHENILITGSTGIGKSYLATALGHQACTLEFTVHYANMEKFFSKLRWERLMVHISVRYQK